jgi:DNA adenine methylase
LLLYGQYFKSLDLPILINNRYFFLEQNNYNNILEVSRFLNHSKGTIVNTSYENILHEAKKGDFVFLDPPYIEQRDYEFNYNKDEILDGDFVTKLHFEVTKLDAKGVKWLMTQADTEQIHNIFSEYNIKNFRVYRKTLKTYVNELLIMNY